MRSDRTEAFIPFIGAVVRIGDEISIEDDYVVRYKGNRSGDVRGKIMYFTRNCELWGHGRCHVIQDSRSKCIGHGVVIEGHPGSKCLHIDRRTITLFPKIKINSMELL